MRKPRGVVVGVAVAGCVVVWMARPPLGAAEQEHAQPDEPSVAQDLERIAQQDPNVAVRLSLLALDAYRTHGQLDRALKLAERLEREHPNETRTLEPLFALYRQVNRHDRVIELGQRLAALHPDNPGYLHKVANAKLARGDTQGAVTDLQAYLRARPDDHAARLRLARLLRDTGNVAEAIPHAEAALKAKPDDLRATLLAAQLYRTNRQPDQARPLLDMILTTSQDMEIIRDAARHLAFIAQAQKTLEAFLVQADSELSKNPDDQAARWKVIEGYAISKKPEAIGRLKALFEETPRSDILRVRLAQAYGKHGQDEQALALLEEGLKTAPDSQAFNEAIADVYVRTSRPEEAIKRYETLLAKATDGRRKALYLSRIEQLRRR